MTICSGYLYRDRTGQDRAVPERNGAGQAHLVGFRGQVEIRVILAKAGGREPIAEVAAPVGVTQRGPIAGFTTVAAGRNCQPEFAESVRRKCERGAKVLDIV